MLPSAANFAGGEYLINRINWMVHPRGFTMTSGALSGAGNAGPTEDSTTNNFGDGATWDRVRQRKNIGITALVTRQT